MFAKLIYCSSLSYCLGFSQIHPLTQFELFFDNIVVSCGTVSVPSHNAYSLFFSFAEESTVDYDEHEQVTAV